MLPIFVIEKSKFKVWNLNGIRYHRVYYMRVNWTVTGAPWTLEPLGPDKISRLKVICIHKEIQNYQKETHDYKKYTHKSITTNPVTASSLSVWTSCLGWLRDLSVPRDLFFSWYTHMCSHFTPCIHHHQEESVSLKVAVVIWSISLQY